MITAITLENFKGIGALVRIPLRPITLMFGANSSGKSTILHAIHYAREILERRNVNPDRTLTGGAAIDLGGFRSLVHNHNLDLPITLRFDLDLRHTDLPDYTVWASYVTSNDEGAPDISGEVDSAFVELVVQWSHLKRSPFVKAYRVGINEEYIVRSTASPDEAQFTLEVNTANPLFIKLFADEEYEQPNSETNPWRELRTRDLVHALPSSWDAPILVDENPFTPDETLFSFYLTQVFVGLGKILKDHLERFRYLGPIRTIPQRNHEPSLTPDESRWADGTAAWDILYKQGDDISLVADLFVWITDDHLKTGYLISPEEFREIPVDSPLSAALSTNTLLDDIENIAEEVKRYPVRTRLRIEDENGIEVRPSDIGVGISQVLPVVIVSLATREGVIAIEQPELHLHPAMQAELGDLFIETALGANSNQYIIETHSEHIILRILRRIRETTGNKNSSTQDITPEDISLLFVARDSNGTSVQSLRIDKHGSIVDRVPGGFFEEGFEELF